MIKLVSVNKWFNRFKKNKLHVINNTSLELEDNGLVALLGPSGSGKTTLLNAIGGLDKINSGKIFIDGKRISSNNQYKVDRIRNLKIGYIFQDYKLVNELSVFDNVALVLKMVGIKDKEEIEKRVLYVLDKVGMLRYKRRPCSMLSGGEKQRVGIARALVKNPSIIIADEPTGNLDSKNSVEIMNIIKAISKERLVILVTHEVNLAKFYASRIIELSDGVITNDYINEHDNDLDYSIDNRFYLKDFNSIENIKKDNNSINLYKDKEDIDIDIVIKNNNIYIRSNNKLNVEVVDEHSNIELIDDSFKTISKKDIESYVFDFDDVISHKKLKYSSIFNPITFITNGLKKVLGYSILKKILLVGFLLSGIFIMYSFSTIFAAVDIKDSNFLSSDRNFVTVKTKKINIDDFNKYKNDSDVLYVEPSDCLVTFKLDVNDIYQFTNEDLHLEGSIVDISTIGSDTIIAGRMPENDYELVVDKFLIKSILKKDPKYKMVGINNYKDFIDRVATISDLKEFKIVGISNNNTPSIYINNRMINHVLYNTNNVNIDIDYYTDEAEENNVSALQYVGLYTDNIVLKEGRMPENDYEVIVNINHKEDMKLNKEIKKKVNDHYLTVVGYYTTFYGYDYYFVNENMALLLLINKSNNITIYPKNMDSVINKYKGENINIYGNYDTEKEKYINNNLDNIKSSIISSLVVLVISLIEILFMIRSSFLSRIKEVGIYRAIGVKKKDIYFMFSGEILAITTLCCLPGILLCAYILNILSGIIFLNGYFKVNLFIILLSIITVYVFNLIIGLLPVYNTLRKRPAEILSRTDI